MKYIKTVLLWILTIFFALLAFAYFPSFCTLTFIIVVALLLPDSTWQSTLNDIFRKKLFKGLAIIALIIVSFLLAPNTDENDPNTPVSPPQSNTESTTSFSNTSTVPTQPVTTPVPPESVPFESSPSEPIPSVPAETEPEPTEHIHTYDKTVTPPSCISQGFTTYSCSCGDSYDADQTAAIGHQWGDWITTKDPTEDEKGTARRICNNCSTEETKDLQPIEPHILFIRWPEFTSRNEDATVTIKGKANTQYSIKVYYTNGASTAKGLENKTSDDDGYVSWTWHIGGKTSAGTFSIVVSGGGDTETVYFTVID